MEREDLMEQLEKERLAKREQDAVIRIPFALMSVVVFLTGQFLLGVWWASSFATENRLYQQQTTVALADAKSKLEELNARVYTQAETVRDMAILKATVQDHENRLRDVERVGRRNPQ